VQASIPILLKLKILQESYRLRRKILTTMATMLTTQVFTALQEDPREEARAKIPQLLNLK
jgi:hypothetical protein